MAWSRRWCTRTAERVGSYGGTEEACSCRPVHVKSAEAELIRTTLRARRQIVATLLLRGLLRMHGLTVGEIHRNRFDKRVHELLEEMPL